MRTGLAVDRARLDREIPYEVWYPAEARYAGLDQAAPTQDSFSALPDGPIQRQSAVRDAGRVPEARIARDPRC